MCRIQDSTRSSFDFETSRENGDFSESFEQVENESETITGYESPVDQANKIPLIKILQHYRLRFDYTNKKAVCPFPSHKGGRESSASFYFYPQTNSFWCFGCNTGSRGCDFVATMEKIGRLAAAAKILEMFASGYSEILPEDDFSEQLSTMMDFSNYVRNFRYNNQNPYASEFITKICQTYDSLMLKHSLNNEALKSVVEKLKNQIDLYIPSGLE